MKVIKATDATINAIRKMDSVTRTFTTQSIRKQSSFFSESSGAYSGPFMVRWHNSFQLRIYAPPEYMGGNTLYAGSILAPDMQVVKHISSDYESFEEGQENTLLVLKIRWDDDEDLDSYTGGFQFVPDPWKTCTSENKLAAIDHVNPKTETYPYRDPYIAIYPIARIEGKKIVQLQRGHIVEYNRWWRA